MAWIVQNFRLLLLIFLINSLISPNNFVILSQAKSSEIDVGSIYSYNISNSEIKTSIEGSGPVISINDQKISSIWDNISGFKIESFENGIIK